MTIGERLREERERLGFTQPDFAALGGKTKKTQIEWEAGNAYPNAVFLEAIAGIGADVLYIITGQRSPGMPEPISRQEAALLDNYRHSPPEAQAALRATSAAFAQSTEVKTTMRKVK